MAANWRRIRLGDGLRRSEIVESVRTDRLYREVTVRLWGKGVVERGVVSGAEISASRRFVAREGQFILSRIDARNGALGIVPASLNGAVVSNDFPLFDVAPAILDAAFLGWLVKTRYFVDLCRRASEGTTNRVRLHEEKLLQFEIAAPEVEEQRRIARRLDAIASRVSEACSIAREADETTNRMSSALATVVFKSHWPTRPLGELADIRAGVTLGRNSSVHQSAPAASLPGSNCSN